MAGTGNCGGLVQRVVFLRCNACVVKSIMVIKTVWWRGIAVFCTGREYCGFVLYDRGLWDSV